jgi:hypothetical protein
MNALLPVVENVYFRIGQRFELLMLFSYPLGHTLPYLYFTFDQRERDNCPWQRMTNLRQQDTCLNNYQYRSVQKNLALLPFSFLG